MSIAMVALGLSFSASQLSGAATAKAKPAVKVGMILEQTGIYSAYETEWRQGFNIGLKYATNGTDRVNGQKLDINWDDDADNPTTAVSDFKAYVGAGYKIIGGTGDSSIADELAPLAAQNKVLYISGAAADDAITGVNRYTFRSGRQTYQDVQTAKSYVEALGTGKTILVLGQDFAFGQSYVTDATNAFKSLGDTVDSLLVPLTTTDFTSTALQVQQDNPDIIFLAWAGTTGAPLMQALQQQGASHDRARRDWTGEHRDVSLLRHDRDVIQLPVALRVRRIDQRSEQVPHQGDGAEVSAAARPLHAGRFRLGADVGARDSNG